MYMQQQSWGYSRCSINFLMLHLGLGRMSCGLCMKYAKPYFFPFNKVGGFSFFFLLPSQFYWWTIEIDSKIIESFCYRALFKLKVKFFVRGKHSGKTNIFRQVCLICSAKTVLHFFFSFGLCPWLEISVLQPGKETATAVKAWNPNR